MDFIIPKLFTDKDYAKKIFTKAGGHGALSVAVGMVNEYAPDFKFTGDVESDWDRLFDEGVNGDVIEDAYGIGLAPLVQAVNEPAKVEDGGLKVGDEETYKLDPTSLALGLAQSRTSTLGSVSVQQTKDIAQACTKSETQAIRDFGQSVMDGLGERMKSYDETIHGMGAAAMSKAGTYIDYRGAKRKTDIVKSEGWAGFKAGGTAMFVFNNDLMKFNGDLNACKGAARYMTLGDQGGTNIVSSYKMFAGNTESGGKDDAGWMNMAKFLKLWAKDHPDVDMDLLDSILDKLATPTDMHTSKMYERPAVQAKIAEYAAKYMEKHGEPLPSQEAAIEYWKRNDRGWRDMVLRQVGIDPETGKMKYRSSSAWMVTLDNDEYDLVIRAVTDPRWTTRIRNEGTGTVVRESSMEKEGKHGGTTNVYDAMVSAASDEMSAEYNEDDAPYDDEGSEQEVADISSGKGTDPLSILVTQSRADVMKALRKLYRAVKSSPVFPNRVKNAEVFTENREFFESDPNAIVNMSKETLCSLVARTLAAFIGSANKAGHSLFDADKLSLSEKDGVMVIDNYGFNEHTQDMYDEYLERKKVGAAKNIIGAEDIDDAAAVALAYMYSSTPDEPNRAIRSPLTTLVKFENKLRPIVAEFTDIFDTGADKGKFDLGEYISETDPEMTASEFIKTVDDTAPSELSEKYVDMLHGIVNKVVGTSKEAMAKFVSDNYGYLKYEFDKYPTLSETMKEIDEIPKPVDRAGAMVLLIVDGYEHPEYFGVNAGELYSAVFKVLSERSMIDTGADDDKKRLTVSEITDWDALDPKVDIAQLIADIAEMDPKDMNEQDVNLLRGLVNAIVGKQLGKFVQQNAKKLATEFRRKEMYPSLNEFINDISNFSPETREAAMKTLIEEGDEDVTPSELYTAVFRVIAGLTSEVKEAAGEEYDPAYAVKRVIRPNSSTVESIAGLKEIAKNIKLGEMLEKALSSMVGVDSISDRIEEIKTSKDVEGLNNLIRTVTSKLGQQFARVRGESGAGTSAEMVGLIDFGVEPDKTVGAESLDKAKDDIEVIAPSVNQLLGLSVADLFGNSGNAHPVVPKSQKNPYKKITPKK